MINEPQNQKTHKLPLWTVMTVFMPTIFLVVGTSNLIVVWLDINLFKISNNYWISWVFLVSFNFLITLFTVKFLFTSKYFS